MRLNKKFFVLIIIALILIIGCTSNETYVVDNDNNGNKYISKHGFEITYPDNWYLKSYVENYEELDLSIQEHNNYFHIFSYNPEVALPGDVTNKDLKIIVKIYDDIPKDIDQWIYADDGYLEGTEILSVDEVDVDYGKAKEVIFKIYSEEEGEKIKERVIYFKDGNKGAIFFEYPFDSMLIENLYQIVKTFKFN